MEKLSFVIPVYNSEKTIGLVAEKICSVAEALETAYDFEIILVNDGSSDNSYEVCRRLASENSHVTAIGFSKNFGQANAIMAGLRQVTGDYIVCLDDDLQTPPEEVPQMLQKLVAENYDLVYGHYVNKKHNFFRNVGTRVNAFMQTVMLGKPKHIATSSFFIARRFAVNEVAKYDKPFPYIPGLFLQVTRNVGNIAVRHESRKVGKSGYTFKKLILLWLNGFTNFSVKPLRWATLAGVIFAFFALILMVIVLIRSMSEPSSVAGWSSTIISVLFLGGVQLLSIGLLGEYIGRIYLSVNKTPQYVVKERVGGSQEDENDGKTGRSI
ncbi:MAG: glycosyltransferase family 2 protein [Bacillota bacterium]